MSAFFSSIIRVKRFSWSTFRNVSPAKSKIARTVPDYVTAQPMNSVLVLTDFTGAVFNQDALRALKETAVFDKPFIKKSALLGTQSFPKDFYEEITSFSRRDLRIFTTREEALTWLVADSAASKSR
jgi:hypothetical protein